MPLALTLSLIVGSLGVSTSPTIEPPITTVEVKSPVVELQKAVDERIVIKPTLESLISKVAQETGVSSTTLYNVAQSESGLQADPQGHNDGGLAAGLVQIHYETWGVTKEQALDPEFSLNFLAQRIKAGDAWKYWSSLNCYAYLKYSLKISGLPKMAQIIANSSLKKGAIAIFNYSGNIKHVAYVTAVNGHTFTVKEANFKAGVIGTREISIDDPYLMGFWYANT